MKLICICPTNTSTLPITVGAQVGWSYPPCVWRVCSAQNNVPTLQLYRLWSLLPTNQKNLQCLNAGRAEGARKASSSHPHSFALSGHKIHTVLMQL